MSELPRASQFNPQPSHLTPQASRLTPHASSLKSQASSLAMNQDHSNRREFLKATAAGCGRGSDSLRVHRRAEEATTPASKNDRFRIGAIGMRYQGTVIAEKALALRRRGGHLRRRSARSARRPGRSSAARPTSTKTTASCSIARTSTW